MHFRTAIRDRAYTLLADLAGGRVYKARLYPLAEDELPAILLWCGDEEIEQTDLAGTYVRHMQLFVELREQASEDLDALLNDLLVQVEVAIAADPNLGGLVYECALAALAFQQSGTGARPSGALRLQYRATYLTDPTNPEI